MRSRFLPSLGLVLAGALLAAPPAAAGEGGKTILGAGSCWRAHATWREGVTTAGKAFGAYRKMKTSPPPADWTRPDFDDSGWFRSPGPFRGTAVINNPYMPKQMRLMSGTLAVRGKFRVDDPAALKKLTLSLAYRGGVAVYLNGQEVARGHLPKGKLALGAPAEPYPLEAYLDPKGKLIPSSSYWITKMVKAGDTEVRKRLAKRERKLGPLSVPLKLLRKGVNVLAVANHSSDYQPAAAKWGKDRKCPHGWYHLGVHRLRLAAEGGGIRPNVARPEGVQTWNQDIHRIFTVAEYGDPSERLGPVRLVGARNGHYSGQVVLGSTSVIEGVKAGVTDLEGPATIPASSIRIRYGALSDAWGQGRFPGQKATFYRWGKTPPIFAPLLEKPPARVEPTKLKTDPKLRAELGLPAQVTPAALVPVWITVHVPKDAPAGKYKGTLAVSAKGIPETKMPVELEVVDWKLPDAGDYRFFMAFYQSPESLALHYEVPRWSEEHWKLIERSWQLLGELGNNLVVVHLLTRTQFGNEESMVAWTRQADGSYKYDYTNFDRYLALATKYCKPRRVSLQVMHAVRDWGLVKATDPRHVTGVDPKSGKREPLKLPDYVTDDAKKALRPMLEGIRGRLKKRKLDGKLVMGMLSDQGIRPEIRKWFEEVFPGVGWHYGAHNRARYPYLRYTEYLYVPHLIGPPGGKRRNLWWQPHPHGTAITMSQRVWDHLQGPMVVRTMAERALILGDHGAGRMCLDFWPVPGSDKQTRCLFNRWPTSTVSQRRPHLRWLALPGKKGALSSIKIEAMREGNQEAEARAFIEEALFVNKSVTGELAERCRKLLDARVNLCRTVHNNYSPRRVACDDGWRKSSEALYRLAAEVAKAAGK